LKSTSPEIPPQEGGTYSINEIEFTAPDKYFQRMISYNISFLISAGLSAEQS
jgi:hypothetical protein